MVYIYISCLYNIYVAFVSFVSLFLYVHIYVTLCRSLSVFIIYNIYTYPVFIIYTYIIYKYTGLYMCIFGLSRKNKGYIYIYIYTYTHTHNDTICGPLLSQETHQKTDSFKKSDVKGTNRPPRKHGTSKSTHPHTHIHTRQPDSARQLCHGHPPPRLASWMRVRLIHRGLQEDAPFWKRRCTVGESGVGSRE